MSLCSWLLWQNSHRILKRPNFNIKVLRMPKFDEFFLHNLYVNIRKNDTIDAQRIGSYAHRFQDKVCLYQPKSKILEEIEHLNRWRTCLVQTRKKWHTALSETMQFVDEIMVKSLEISSRKTMNALEKDIQNLEAKIQQLIFSDGHLRQLYQLTLSVQGVGKVTATQILIKTQGFTKFKTARQFACYCGVVPFEHSSGKFRGKERVSQMADKQLKSLLYKRLNIKENSKHIISEKPKKGKLKWRLSMPSEIRLFKESLPVSKITLSKKLSKSFAFSIEFNGKKVPL